MERGRERGRGREGEREKEEIDMLGAHKTFLATDCF